ncbi:hypothetical protein K435DRAFT_872233 [Dendrothele bispora CBS 962.96]|uniref:Uncharacterized protein n=1 Tax=Dendrothele bispora (strain CBS 962.96) TaxID=1314807 RepID=A0A4S8L269_DENBC|nr:hypothetical protein K435DRAFT_872233 [Dendrothele bispora CBS 962.96]
MDPAPVMSPYKIMTIDQIVLEPRLDPKVRLSNNADPEQWTWPESGRWRQAPSHWQSFYLAWSGATVDPRKAEDLSTISDSTDFFPDFVVRSSYKRMVDEVLKLGLEAPSRGALMVGQPGVVTQVALAFLFAYLLALQKTIRTVYEMKEDNMSRSYLPDSKSNSESKRVFLWSLIDDDDKNQLVPSHLYALECFPVHTTSPNSNRFSVWRKERNPKLFGFARWSDEELFNGFLVQPECPTFCNELRKYKGIGEPAPTPDEHRCAYDILQNCYESSGEEATSMKLEEALKALLKAATEEIGVAPRDVYQFIFRPKTVNHWHQQALSGLSYDNLLNTVIHLHTYRSHPNSGITHRVISVYPVQKGDSTELHWEINFKSPAIASMAFQRLEEYEKDRDVEMYRRFKSFQEGSALAGWFFESIANKRLASGNTSGLVLVPMVKGGTDDSPIYSINFSGANPTAVGLISLLTVKSDITVFDGKSKNPLVLTNRFYKLQASNNPLFDAFYALRTDKGGSNAVFFELWIFQHTIARSHGGSDLGYPLIRKIIRGLESTVKNEAQSETSLSFSTKVHYVLVVPKDSKNDFWEWTMPAGYNTGTRFQDHRGDFHCLRLPLTVCLASISGITTY